MSNAYSIRAAQSSQIGPSLHKLVSVTLILRTFPAWKGTTQGEKERELCSASMQWLLQRFFSDAADPT